MHALLRPIAIAVAAALVALIGAGCGSSSSSTSSPSQGAASVGTGTQTPAGGGSAPGAGALSAEAKSAATGDIPDTQAFLTYSNRAAGYSMSYPEGWTQKGAGKDVTISDKNNVIHVVTVTAPAPTGAGLAAELSALKSSNPTLSFTSPTTVQLKSGPAVKATYTTRSAPNPVTGKTVLLIVDRYELGKGGKRTTVDLGTPRGVDNVDAYKRIVNSFRWQ
jgi:hypothetical protein